MSAFDCTLLLLVVILYGLAKGEFLQVSYSNGKECLRNATVVFRCSNFVRPVLSWEVAPISGLEKQSSLQLSYPLESRLRVVRDFAGSSPVVYITSANGTFISSTLTILNPTAINGSRITCNRRTITMNAYKDSGVKLPEDITLEVNRSVLYFSWRQVDFNYAQVFTYNSITKVNVSDGVISYNSTELIDYIRISLCPNGRYYSQFSVGISVYEDIANGTASYSKYKLYSNGTWTSESTSEARVSTTSSFSITSFTNLKESDTYTNQTSSNESLFIVAVATASLCPLLLLTLITVLLPIYCRYITHKMKKSNNTISEDLGLGIDNVINVQNDQDNVLYSTLQRSHHVDISAEGKYETIQFVQRPNFSKMSIEGYEDVPLIYDNTSGTSKVVVNITDHTMESVVDMHTADIKMVPAKSPTPPPLPPPFNPHNENTTSNNKQQETDIPSLPFLLDDMGTAEMDSRVNQEEIDCEEMEGLAPPIPSYKGEL